MSEQGFEPTTIQIFSGQCLLCRDLDLSDATMHHFAPTRMGTVLGLRAVTKSAQMITGDITHSQYIQ